MRDREPSVAIVAYRSANEAVADATIAERKATIEAGVCYDRRAKGDD